MTKWFWHISLALFLLAGLLAVVGWMTMPRYPLDTSVLKPKPAAKDPSRPEGSESSKPESESALVAAAREFSRRLGPPVGNLVVHIEPKEAVEAGALWAISSNNWHRGGETLENIKGGKYKLQFKTVPEWQTPSGQTVEIKRDETTEITVTYQRIQYGDCQLTLAPEAAIQAGARWQVHKSGWQESGRKVEKLVVGEYPVQFKPIEGWRVPKAFKIKVEENRLVQAEARYEKIEYGALQVQLDPNEAAGVGLKWRVKGQAWTAQPLLEPVEVGTYTVEFQGNDDWTAPPAQQVTVEKDQTTRITAVYRRIPKGTVRMTLGPEDKRLTGAQWQVDNGPWQASGAAFRVKAGKHTIKFKAVKGWTSPKPVTLEVADGQLIEQTVEYILQKPPGPNYAVTMTIAAADGNGLAYIRMPADPKEKLYRVGDKVGDYRLAQIKVGAVVLVKDGFDYELKIPKPDPSRQVQPKAEPSGTKSAPGRVTGPSKPAGGTSTPRIPYSPTRRLPTRPSTPPSGTATPNKNL